MTRRIATLFLLLTSLLTFCQAAPNTGKEKHRWEQARYIDNLPCKMVSDLLQDAEGFLWIGTKNGLFRYDGMNLRAFRNDLRDVKFLSSNDIVRIAEQGDYLWIATTAGLDRLCLSSLKTEHISDDALPCAEISELLVSRRGTLWIGTQKGLYSYDKENDTFVLYDSAYTRGVIPNDVEAKCILEDHLGQIWMGTWSNGIYRLDFEHQQFYHYPSLNWRNNAHVLLEDNHKQIWVGTWDCGLQRLKNAWDPANVSAETWTTADGLSSNIIYSLAEDVATGKLIIGTQRGLDEAIPQASFKAHDEIKYQITSNRIRFNEITAIIRDHQNQYWIGMMGLGAAHLNMQNEAFGKNLLTKALEQVNTASVGSMAIDNDENLWLGLGTAGLAIVDTAGIMRLWNEHPLFRNEPQMATVYGLHKRASDGHIWFSTYAEYIYDVDCEKGSIKRYRTSESAFLPFIYVYAIEEDHNGNLWFGCTGGIGCLHPDGSTEILDTLLLEPDQRKSTLQVIEILEDRLGNLWLATSNNGIIRLELQKDGQWQKTCFNRENGRLLTNSIQSLYCDSQGNIWLGSANCGLFKYNPKEQHFEALNNRWSLPCVGVSSILEEPANPLGVPGHIVLWLGTENGLIFLDIAADGQTASVFHYLPEDGLQDYIFNARAAVIGNDDKLYFGGLRGYNAFYPNEVYHDASKLKVKIINLSVGDQSWIALPEHERNRISRVAPRKSKELVFDHTQNNFTIEFSALDLVNPQRQSFIYMLAGYDTLWHYCDANIRQAHYSALSPGDYTFLCQISNSPESQLSVRIEVLPAPWMTWWAYMLYGILFVGLCFGTGFWVRRYTKAQQNLRIRVLQRQRQIEELQEQAKAQQVVISQQLNRQQIQEQTHAINIADADDEFLTQAIGCINAHLGDADYSQQDFINEMGISKTTCFRRLKALTGLSFPNFARNIRMNAACRALEQNPNLRISELAYSLGYNDARYFSTCFKKEIGMLPSEYAQQATQDSLHGANNALQNKKSESI